MEFIFKCRIQELLSHEENPGTFVLVAMNTEWKYITV